MSKLNQNQSKLKSEDPVIKPINPEGLNYLGYLMTDATNLRNFATAIFQNNIDIADKRFIENRDAAKLSLLEIEDDITKLREFLDSYA